MNDRELLELAAKAAGGLVQWEDCVPWYIGNEPGVEYEWNPLTNDGDALRLAVDLEITVSIRADKGKTCILDDDGSLLLVHMHFDDGPIAATRRAIVRAAAEIGRKMQEGGAK